MISNITDNLRQSHSTEPESAAMTFRGKYVFVYFGIFSLGRAVISSNRIAIIANLPTEDQCIALW